MAWVLEWEILVGLTRSSLPDEGMMSVVYSDLFVIQGDDQTEAEADANCVTLKVGDSVTKEFAFGGYVWRLREEMRS